jgi:hypothetical protein
MRDLSLIGNEALVRSFLQLVRDSQVLCADLIEHLAEVEARGLFRERGYGWNQSSLL